MLPCDKVQVPLEVIDYVQQHKLVKPFAVFLALKCGAGGVVKYLDVLSYVPKTVGIKDKRTLDTHLVKLIQLNWLGYNTRSSELYVRGFGAIRKQHGFKKRTAATFIYLKHIKKIQAFVAGSLIAANIKRQQYFFEVAMRGRLKSAAVKLGAAQQGRSLAPVAIAKPPEYYGISVNTIAQLLHCSVTRACELKHQAEKAGFIKTKEHLREIAVFEKADAGLKGRFALPEESKRIRFRKITRHGLNKVGMFEQLHDEIKPKVAFKRIKRYNHI